MEYDYKILEARMKSLPKDLQLAMASVDVANAIQDIADKNDLMLDQASDLTDEVGYVMMGLSSADKFVDTLVKKLGVKREVAIKIATEVNTEIFDSIRSSLQKIQAEHVNDNEENTDNMVSDVEKAGNFTIEKETTDQPESQTGAPISREKVLNAIENPQFHNTKPINVLEAVSKNDEMADHMLSGTVSKRMTTTEIKAEPVTSATPTAPAATPATTLPPQKSRPGPDPYREPIA
jgi:restriction endonuclease